jgi:hypothetical protein
VAEVLQYDSSGTLVPFTLQIEVHDEQGKLASEEQDISPQQLEKWIVLLDNECKGKGIYKPPKLDADGFVIDMSREKKQSGHEVFATPAFGQTEALHCALT